LKTSNILKKIDKLNGYNEKLEYLNKCFLKAKNAQEENLILDMIKQLKFFGQ